MSNLSFSGGFDFIKDIKFSHSIFALPFAASSLLIDINFWPSTRQIFLLLICMISGRSFAMATNRIVDRKIDALNLRTKSRALPSGTIPLKSYLVWTVLSAATLVMGSFLLNSFVGYLSFLLLAILVLYGYLKRFTVFVHWYLGCCLAISPIAVLLALGVFPSPSVFLLSFAVIVWTAGFDILYSMQDLEFDTRYRLRSIPSWCGAAMSKNISFVSFAVMIITLISIGVLQYYSWIYYCGLFMISLLFVWMYLSLKDLSNSGKSSNINKVFFDINAFVGVIYLMVVVLEKFF